MARLITGPRSGHGSAARARGRLLVLIAIVGYVAMTGEGLSASPQSQTASLLGIVSVGAGPEGRPARRVRVSLVGQGAEGVVATDTDGRFSFANLSPGRYEVSLEKDGFVMTSDEFAVRSRTRSSRTVQVSAGTPQTIHLVMAKAGAIEGYVKGMAGKAAIGAVVEAFARESGGAAQPPRAVATTKSDDQGKFRLHTLEPGSYVVGVHFRGGGTSAAAPSAGGDTKPTMYFYGANGGGPQDAAPVNVNSGSEVIGIDITLPSPVPQPELTLSRPSRTVATGRIGGSVVDARTGRPIAGATVRILTQQAGATSTTGADGAFRLEHVPPGQHTIFVSADGYVGLRYGQRSPEEFATPVALAEDQQIQGIVVVLPPEGVVEGYVTDEFGDPAPRVRAFLARLDYLAGRRLLLPVGAFGSNSTTDDRGYFRIYAVPPGRYYLVALSGALGVPGGVGGFATTYFPGVQAIGSAQICEVTPAIGLVTTNFAMNPTVLATIQGRVVSELGAPIESSLVSLVPADLNGALSLALTPVRTGPTGAFTFRDVPPGRYVVQAATSSARMSEGEYLFGSEQVSLAAASSPDVVVRALAPRRAIGRIVFEGAETRPTPAQLRVSAVASDLNSAPAGGGPRLPLSVRDDWTFELGALFGHRVIRAGVSGPGEWFLKSVVVNGVDLTDAPVSFDRGDVGNIVVTLTSRAASLSGSVRDAKGLPAPAVNILVYPVDSQRRQFPSRYVTLGRTDESGRYSIRGLPDGDYFVVAVRYLSGNMWLDPDFLETMSSFGIVVRTVGAGTFAADLVVR